MKILDALAPSPLPYSSSPLTLLLLSITLCQACTLDPSATDQPHDTIGQETEPPQQQEVKEEPTLPPVVARGNLPWFERLLFLLDDQTRPSWLFELDQTDHVTFELSGQGPSVSVDVQINRWLPDAGEWAEVSWVQTRADTSQDVVIERELDPGYYWLIVGAPEAEHEPLPFSLVAECSSGACVNSELLFAPEAPKSTPTELPELLAGGEEAVGLTPHFRAWLDDNGYADFDFPRADLEGGSFGGKRAAFDPVTRDPVIFIHGNGDRAFGGLLGGWTASLAAFDQDGYTSAELYAITWGSANPLLASTQYHSGENLVRVRQFIEAVLDYTGSERVDIITHSMGVTLARRAILGGDYEDTMSGETIDLGAPLTERVDAFVGIAGANRGLLACGLTGPVTPTCSALNGLYPGMYLGRGGRSRLLRELDEQTRYEGQFTASIWSRTDELINSIGGGIEIWGEPTSRIPAQDTELVLDFATHLQSKDDTTSAQLELVQDHAVTSD